MSSLEADAEVVRRATYLLGREPVNGSEKQEWAESAAGLCASREKCLPATWEVRAPHAQSRDAVLSGNGRPFYLCSVGGWKLLQEEHALSCHCLAQSFAGGHPTGGVTSAGRPRHLWWTTSWRLRGRYVPHSWAASPFWKGNWGAVSL